MLQRHVVVSRRVTSDAGETPAYPGTRSQEHLFCARQLLIAPEGVIVLKNTFCAGPDISP